MSLPDLNIGQMFRQMGEKEIGSPRHVSTRVPITIYDYLEALAREKEISFGAAMRYLLMMGVKENQYQERQIKKGERQ